jgi:hypothetical protein
MPTFSFSPDEEYSIQDLTVTAVRRDGARFPFRKGDVGLLERFMYDPKPESKTVAGSGSNPRAHTRTVNKPVCDADMPADTGAKFKRFVGRDGVVTMVATRRTPSGPAVTDHVVTWKPLFGGVEFKSGDPTIRKITGNALRIDEDVKGSLA